MCADRKGESSIMANLFLAATLFLGLAGLSRQQTTTTTPLPATWHALYVQPEQLHLALGENPREMVVTWTTFNATAESTCHYGLNEELSETATGKATHFEDGGHLRRFMFIHRVYLSNLQPNSTYHYHCGSHQGFSPLFYFRTLPDGTEWSPRFVVYGDLGNINGRTLGRLTEEVQRHRHDVLLHVGDMAYNLHTDNAQVGDEFMRQIEPIAAYIPYQVCPGNHEQAYNFSNYVARFSMHSQGHKEINNHFWSYNIGPVHLVAFSTEFHYFIQYGTHQILNQYNWLEEDLKEANKPENRAKHPWIITIGHRPLYNQVFENELLRNGHTEEGSHVPGFEELFYRYGVDLQFYGHEHNYERLFPVYKNQTYSGSPEEPYRNPKAPVHIITGSAGCRELITPIRKTRHAYSAFIVEDYGFTHMQVMNATHIHIQQLSEDKGGKIVDDFFIVKEKHGPDAWK